MNQGALISNIQRFSLHDGPGIRTTVFFMGCSLRCPWCSNPENLRKEQMAYVKDGREGVYGIYCTQKELYSELIKDRVFYTGEIVDYQISDVSQIEKLPGGVTFSGGEALLHLDGIEETLIRLKKDGIHLAVESCLFVPESKLELALKYIDLFYVDVKAVEPTFCKNILGGTVEQYLNNMELLLSSGKPVIIRVPVIGRYTDDIEIIESNIQQILTWKSLYKNLLKVEVIKGHNLGEDKYKSLGMELPMFLEVNDDALCVYIENLSKCGMPCEVCKI